MTDAERRSTGCTPETFDEDRIPECFPDPEESQLPPQWPNGADPEFVVREAKWGDDYATWLLDRAREHNDGIAVDGEHRDLSAYAADGGDVDE